MRSSGVRSIVITPHTIRMIALIMVLVGIGGYFGWHLYNLFRPPALVITHPSGDIITEEQNIEFSGSAQRESDIFINGIEVKVAHDGAFHEWLALQQGTNIFEVKAINRFGKETVFTRRIIKHLELRNGF